MKQVEQASFFDAVLSVFYFSHPRDFIEANESMLLQLIFTALTLSFPVKGKAPQTLHNKGFEALFSYFKLILSEPRYYWVFT